MKYIFILLGLMSVINTHANVLQERKPDNKSNDAFIPVVPSNQFDKKNSGRRYVPKIHSHGSFKKAFAGNTENLEEVPGKFTNERMSPMFISESKNISLNSVINTNANVLQEKENENESNETFTQVVPFTSNQFDKNKFRRRYVPKAHSHGSFKKAFAGNTEYKREKKKSDTIEDILEEILGKFTNDRMSPIFRSESKNIKSEIIHFRNDKPTAMYEINTNTFLKFMQEILASEPVEKFVDKVARKAGVVFRSSMRDEKPN